MDKSKGDFIRAIKDFTAALTSNPNSANILGERGITYASIGDNDSAIADFNEAISFDKNNAITYSNRGGAYMQKGELNKAITDFETALKIKPDFAEAKNNLAMAKQARDSSVGGSE